MSEQFQNICPHWGDHKRTARRVCCRLLLGLLLACISTTVQAQKTEVQPKATVKTETFTTADGWSFPVTYYQSSAGKEAPVVILLHDHGSNQLVWKNKPSLAERLHAEDFAVITCDLRKNGQAKNPRASGRKLEALDYQAMASPTPISELSVIQAFLYQEHQAGRLNMAKLGILAVGDTVPIALTWAAADWVKKPFQDAPAVAAMTPRGQTVHAIAMLSPSESVTGVNASAPLRYFRTSTGAMVSLLFMSGSKDGSGRDVRSMLKAVSTPANKSVIYSQSFPTNLKGADLIRRVPKADDLVVGFFKKQLKDLNIPWQDRSSRLNRK